MQIIIPMSGAGQRFIDAGYKDPKPLITVDGRPIIDYIFDLFPGETNIHCICSETHLQTTNMRSVLEKHSATIHSIPSHKLGPVYTVLQIADSISDDDEVIISYCDYGTVWNYQQFLSTARESDGCIAAYTGFHPHMLGKDNYAFMRLNDDGKTIAEIREKEPFTADRMSEYASNGTYYFKKGSYVKKYFADLIEKNINKNGEFYISLVYNLMIRDGLVCKPFKIERMLQFGTPYDLEIYEGWARHFKRAAQPVVKSSATLILPMAGRGSRFSMVGYKDPKPLLPVKDEPMIVQAVKSIPACKRQVFITLNEHLEAYDLAFTLYNNFPNCQIIGIDGVTEGQACTTEIGIKAAGLGPDDPILVSACDNGVDYDSASYAALEADPSVDVIVWSFNNNPTSKLFPHMYAWLDVCKDGSIKHVSVKKHFEGAEHCIIGTMFFRRVETYMEGLRTIYEKNIRTNGEYYVDDLLNPLIEAGYNVKIFPVDAYICWGTPADYKTYCYWHEHFSSKYNKFKY